MEAVQSSPLGDLLLRTRKRADLTQEALAERAGVSVNTISNLEAGRGHLPRQGTLDLLVNALAVALMLAPAEQARLRASFVAATARARQAATAGEGDAGPDARVPALLPAGSLTFLVCAPMHDAGGQSFHLHLSTGLQQLVSPRNGHLLEAPSGPAGAVAVFRGALDALAMAAWLQQAHALDTDAPVRLGLHTGWAEPGEGDYAGPIRRRATRLARLAHPGQVLLSQACHDRLRHALPEGVRLREVGRQSLCAVERPQQLYQLLPAGTPAAFPPLRPPEGPPTNLPMQVTSFVGREREQAALEALLAQAPLVTLTGTGGCGKSRLALLTAADLLESFPDGVWLVELASLSDPALVSRAVAAVLGVREVHNQPLLETLVAALTAKRLLLLLDNCEHLLARCAELVAELLARCPSLQILATSRERLAIRGETTYRVPSLSLSGMVGHEDAVPGDSEAVRLFVERARAALPAFALTGENAGTVAHICSRLDGIPLAIELAAARTAFASLETIAARLDQRIGALEGGPRDLPARHQTIRATLDWSWALLGEQEQALLRRLAVFAGGWRLGAAVAVCAGDGLADWAAPDLLEGLVNKSLVILDERDSAARFALLEPVRAYAAERLAEAGERDVVRDRHLGWCVALAEEAAGKLKGPEQTVWLARLEREHDNLRAALGWASERGAGEEGLRLVGAIWRFWLIRGYLSEGRRWLDMALAAGTRSSDGVHTRALDGAGTLAEQQGDYDRAVSLHEEALTLRRALGDTPGMARALNNLGNVAERKGEYARARALLQESLALWRVAGDTLGIAGSLTNQGNVAERQGEYASAAALHEEALTLMRASGDTWGVAIVLDNLGIVLSKLGQYERATRLIEESLALERALGDTQGIAYSLGHLGHIAVQQGDYERATALHEEALGLRRALGEMRGITNSLHDLATLAAHRGDHARAATLLAEGFQYSLRIGARDAAAEILESLSQMATASAQSWYAARLGGAAETLREAIGLSLPPHVVTAHEAAVRTVRDALGEAAFAAAWSEGQAMPYEQVIRLVLESPARAVG